MPSSSVVYQSIEVDPDETSIDSSSTSLASSIFKYQYRHGRRYASARNGNYLFPNDDPEQDRLNMVHHTYFRILNDRLFLCPIDLTNKRVLDIGTGTGAWAIDVGDRYPSAESITGVDISPIQPSWVPPNVKFYIDDVEADWVGQTYDFIHCRYMAGSISDWPRLVRQCYNNLKPGGWIEFHETANVMYSEDGSLDANGPIMTMMNGLMLACDMIGQTMDPAPKIKGWVEDAGFVNVTEQRFKLPVGSWPRDERLKECGSLLRVNFVEGVDAFTAALYTEVLGWKREEVLVLNEQVRKEAVDGSVHAIFDFLVIIAQKPAQ
ncbi:hypothetical protein EYZ11_010974 [Aspergillus tanneri]|uniref:Methyltransferase domain-containing protein n=1 Tax=Aspergillus tanneri TaxID=1220188 RepID=A0A4S3J422_9EURO|nr:uncharacterized protein ATNIH1004_003705 [Aspergillus tanneri]KAA8651014.1 hypothetical protein ATNIH1004_003705 [Aspergillus tanneri]THC89580.1 hypothetical protein EYZ11_010974 [Aspergillus tanneri]